MEDSHACFSSTVGTSDRQVVLCSSFQHFNPYPVEAITISIVNDRQTGKKRGREKIEGTQPNCSGSGFKDDNEWEDSLLDPSDSDGDSPLYLTVDEIESLLEDDCCQAAEASNSWDSEEESEQTLMQQRSESGEIENNEHHSMPEETTLTLEEELEKEISNYAAMAPDSTCSLHSADLSEANGMSNSAMAASPSCNLALVGAIEDGELRKRDDSQAVSETDIVPVCPSNSTWTAEDPAGTSPQQFDLGILEEDCEGSELSFDCDIDELLALSPGEITSEEEGHIPLVSSVLRCEMEVGDLGSETTDLPLDSIQPCLSLSTANLDLETAGSVTFPSESHSPVSLGEQAGADASSQEERGEDTMTNTLTTKTEQQTPIKTEENQTCHTTLSIAVDKPDVQKLGTQQVSAPVDVKIALSTSAPAKPTEKKLGTVAHLPNSVFRPHINPHQLEEDKHHYFNHVMMHLDGQSMSSDTHHELALLMNQISSENANWQHPSDFTMRNHPRSGRRRLLKCSLGDWVKQNGDSRLRFQGLPCTFQRSPIPEFVPSRPF
uniref:S100P-binding protein n=1 Tax=Leptobrachium leishanense TaxID=445787 RepID=A0A8C5LZZ6_9ANUR